MFKELYCLYTVFESMHQNFITHNQIFSDRQDAIDAASQIIEELKEELKLEVKENEEQKELYIEKKDDGNCFELIIHDDSPYVNKLLVKTFVRIKNNWIAKE